MCSELGGSEEVSYISWILILIGWILRSFWWSDIAMTQRWEVFSGSKCLLDFYREGDNLR